MRNLLRYNSVFIVLLCALPLFAQPLQDPTRPKVAAPGANLAAKAETKEALLLQSVFVKKSGYLAVISGNIVKLGDRVDEYRVTQIDAQSVTLKQGQKTKILRLYQHEIKQ